MKYTSRDYEILAQMLHQKTIDDDDFKKVEASGLDHT